MTDRRLVIEVSIATIITVSILSVASHIPTFSKYASTAVVLFLIYVPVLMNRWRAHPLVIEGLGWKTGFVAFLAMSLVAFPPFLIGAHFWQKWVFGSGAFHLAKPPSMQFVAVQLLAVALPEEFFFRGYLQTALNRFFQARWTLFGTRIGAALPLVALVFAFAHSLISFRWWHFAIFFPALGFGFLRDRTNGIIAPTMFHAACNILMDWFIRSY